MQNLIWFQCTAIKHFLEQITCGLIGILLAVPAANADIYSWTDEKGVRHFTNYAPPPQANIIIKTEELPFDELADKERMALERQDQLTTALQELADKEARLAEMQLAAEKRIEAASRKAEEALEQAETLLDQAQYESSGDTGSRYLYYGYYPYKRRLHRSMYDRWYYRNRHSFYHKKPHVKHYHKNYYNKKHRYKKRHDDKYRGGHRQRYQTGRSVTKRHSMSIRGGIGYGSLTSGQRSFGFRR